MVTVQFHPKKTLVPKPVTNGTRMWSVAVEAWSPVMEKYKQGKKDYATVEVESLITGCAGMKP
jgi:hypothetical protein